MLRVQTISTFLNGRPSTRREFDHVTVRCKKKRQNSGPRRYGEKRNEKYTAEDMNNPIAHLFRYSLSRDRKNLVKDYNIHINNCIREDNLIDAQEVFDQMIGGGPKPNIVTYTTLMKGYSEANNTHKVFELFKDLEKMDLIPTIKTFSTVINACANNAEVLRARMLLDKMQNKYLLTPTVVIFNSVLKVCVKAKNLEAARMTFKEAISSGARLDVITLNTMIDAYAECCTKERAREYFEECMDMVDGMEEKGMKTNLQTFNCLLKLCARGSLTRKAIKLLNEMRRSRIFPNVVSYNITLDGVSKNKNLSIRQTLAVSSKIINSMRKRGIPAQEHTYTALMNIALKAKDLAKAMHLFNELKENEINTTIAAYGTMIKCYEKLGDPSKGHEYIQPCLELLAECDRERIKVNGPCYTSLLSACANIGDIDTASEIWNRMLKEGTKLNVISYNAMINVYASVGDLKGAAGILNELKRQRLRPNIFTYGALIKCYAKYGDPTKKAENLTSCLELMEECDLKRIKLDGPCYTSLLSACANASNLDIALKLWNRMSKEGIERDVISYNAMMNVYGRAGDLKGAIDLFNEIKDKGLRPDAYTYGIMIKCYAKLGDLSKGAEYLKPCLDLLTESEDEGTRVDETCYISMLTACANVSNCELALKLWNKMPRQGLKRDNVCYTAMINVYYSMGDLSSAISLFKEMKEVGLKPDAYTYGIMIKSYAKLGDLSKGDEYLKPCLDLLVESENEKYKANAPCYISLLSACTNASNLKVALELWNKMPEEGIVRDVVCYNAMINVCLSVDRVDKAFEFLDDMIASGIKPNVVTYGTLLIHFVRKNDKSRAKKVHEKMKSLGVQSDKAILKTLNAIGLN
eukprot:g3218.t1